MIGEASLPKTSPKQRSIGDSEWPTPLSHAQREQLSLLVQRHQLSTRAGELKLIEGSWYITHAGLLRMAQRNRCSGIQTEVITELSDSAANRWVVKATVYKTPRSKGFVGYGDADPGNVSPLFRGAEMRIAETRAVNRALRKAYGIGLCSVEELGTGGTSRSAGPVHSADNRNGNGQPRLRDRLLLFIRQYQLDAEQVKLYAAYFCGTASLRETSREQIQSFLDHLAKLAAEGRDKLVAEIASVSATTKGNGDERLAQVRHKEAA